MSTGQSNRNATRETILDAAVRLFAERGPAITLDQIAQQAGISRQSVYVHFGSRTGLLLAMVQHVDAGGMLDGLIQQVTNAPSATEALDAVAHLHAEYSPAAYPVARAILRGRHDDEALQVAWDDRMEGRRNLYRFVVRRLQDEGLLAPQWDAEGATEMLFALASWQVWEQLVVDQNWSKERYRHLLANALRGALIARTA